MTKFVKCIDDKNFGKYLTKGKIYEVESECQQQIFIKNDIGVGYWYFSNRFEEVKQEETKFRFIPKTEITEVTVNGIEGILIKE